MLLHGIQGFQGSRILIPTHRDLQPNRDFPARTLRERLQPPRRSLPPNAASALLCDAPRHRRKRVGRISQSGADIFWGQVRKAIEKLSVGGTLAKFSQDELHGGGCRYRE